MTDVFLRTIVSPSRITGKLFLLIVPGRWKQISSHFWGARRSPNGRAVSARNVIISCNPPGVSVNTIWSSAYSIDAKWKLTSLIPTNVTLKDQLTNASATVKKLGDAGQPWRTPRRRGNAGPHTSPIRTLAFASRYRHIMRRTIDGERKRERTQARECLLSASKAPL